MRPPPHKARRGLQPRDKTNPELLGLFTLRNRLRPRIGASSCAIRPKGEPNLTPRLRIVTDVHPGESLSILFAFDCS
jgi:hypothetical protein